MQVVATNDIAHAEVWNAICLPCYVRMYVLTYMQQMTALTFTRVARNVAAVRQVSCTSPHSFCFNTTFYFPAIDVTNVANDITVFAYATFFHYLVSSFFTAVTALS